MNELLIINKCFQKQIERNMEQRKRKQKVHCDCQKAQRCKSALIYFVEKTFGRALTNYFPTWVSSKRR